MNKWFVTAPLLAVPLLAPAWEFRGEVALEGRYFTQDSPYPQADYDTNSSAYLKPEILHEWNDRDDLFTFIQSALDDTQPVAYRPELDRPVLRRAFSIDHQYIVAVLVTADGLIVNQNGLALSASSKSGSRKHAGRQITVWIGHDSPGADSARAPINLVTDKI